MQIILIFVVIAALIGAFLFLLKYAIIFLLLLAQIVILFGVTKEFQRDPLKDSEDSRVFKKNLANCSFLVAVLSLFMNWSEFATHSRTGIEYGFFALLLLWAYPLLMINLKKSLNVVWGIRLVVANLAISEIFMFKASNYSTKLVTVNALSSGATLYFISSLIFLAGVISYCVSVNKNKARKDNNLIDENNELKLCPIIDQQNESPLDDASSKNK